jgi:hypothetical protein
MMEQASNKERIDLSKILLISIYTIVSLGPAFVWANLSMGLSMSLAAQFFALFLLSEIMRLSGRPPKVQEAFLIYFLSSNVNIGINVINWVYNAWFRVSPIARSLGFADCIPDWFAPPPSANSLMLRTFFLTEWAIPIILQISFFFLNTFSAISLGLMTYNIYGKDKRIPFPLAQVSAQFCYSMVELKGEKERIFIIGAIIGLVWSFLAYGVPLISKGIFEVIIAPIPIPWLDFNKFIEIWFPGGSFGVSTDLFNLVIGMLIPSIVAYSVFIGSFAIQFIGNHILVKQGIFTEWVPGTSISLALQRSILRFWTGPIIGMALSSGVMPILLSLFLLKPKNSSGFILSLKKMKDSLFFMVIFVVSSLTMVIIANLLIPQYPAWIFILLSLGWSFALALISARSIGMTGLSINVPYVSEGLYIASGYKNIDVFFLPPIIATGSDQWCQIFKIAELTGTPIKDTVKPALILLPISIIVGFASVEFAWRLFPIPSRFYPWTEQVWPMNAAIQGLWISTLSGNGAGQSLSIDPIWIGVFFVAMSLLQILKVPVSAVSIVLGATLPIPSSFTILLGSIIAKIIEKFKGKAWWNQQRSTFTAGMLLGLGIPIIVGAAVALIAGSIWPMPY